MYGFYYEFHAILFETAISPPPLSHPCGVVFFLWIYFFNISIQKNSPILAEIKINLQILQYETTHPFLLMQDLIEKDS